LINWELAEECYEEPWELPVAETIHVVGFDAGIEQPAATIAVEL
jgi:hypothetical protein